MFQRIRQWFTPDTSLSVMMSEPPTVPRPRFVFPHKPDALPCVEGFEFEALLLDGRVLRGKVMMLGGARWLTLCDPSMSASTLRAQTHSVQGWRHVE